MTTRKALTIAGLLPLAALIVPVAAAAANTQGRTCVEPYHRFINGATAGSITLDLPAVLPAGVYDITIHTSDGYDTRPDSDPAKQAGERVRVLDITTPDLVDGVAYDEATTTARNQVIAAPLSKVTAYHAHAGGYDSVVLDYICFEPVPVEPPTTQPEPPVTVTIPAPDPTPLCLINGEAVHLPVCPADPPPTSTTQPQPQPQPERPAPTAVPSWNG